VNDKFLHRLILEKMLLKDALQSGFSDVAVFDSLWMNNHNRAILADAQAVSNGAGNVLRVAGVVKAMPLDQLSQPFFQLLAAI
jgi:hypothetical protein